MDKQFYTVQDISKILTIGITKAYTLVASDGFPSIKLGRRYLVPKDAFDKWVKTYTYHEYKL